MKGHSIVKELSEFTFSWLKMIQIDSDSEQCCLSVSDVYRPSRGTTGVDKDKQDAALPKCSPSLGRDYRCADK